MKISAKTLIWGIAILLACFLCYLTTQDILESSSSTAALGFLVLPFLFVFVLFFAAGLMFSLLTVYRIATGRVRVYSLKGISSIVMLLVTFGFIIFYWDVSGLSEAKTESEISKKLARYEGIPILDDFAKGFALESPQAPQSLLEQEVLESNYQASHNPAISGPTLERLIEKMSTKDWGILCNLAAHPNLTEKGAKLLFEKSLSKFESPGEEEGYRDCVLGQLEARKFKPDRVR